MSSVLNQKLNSCDEKEAMCVCGHLESEHGSRLQKIGNRSLRLSNDGSCCCGNCECPKFRWDRWVEKDEIDNLKELLLLHEV